ncbi:hypothetical protein BV20DRAFT_1055283 [Pilatotrama ljubarskyi]|nr:hypothetical protein BV20DRAFT_1055283 [Pilatotrama ljubarskyi]
MEHRHVLSHAKTEKHKYSSRSLLDDGATCEPPECPPQPTAEAPWSLPDPEDAVSLNTLWDPHDQHTVRIDNNALLDIFSEATDALAVDDEVPHPPWPTSIHGAEELVYEDIEEVGNAVKDAFHFGFDMPPPNTSGRPPAPSNIKATSPTYPWPSLSMFLMHSLFSSSMLRFSEWQKTAILGWAKALQARDVPSLYALNKCHSHIQDLVGDPTRKVVSTSGNVFYLNDVADAIAKEYSNPLTRFAMSD